MTPLQQQFEILRDEFSQAQLQMLPSGAALIVVPGFPLPAGWSKVTVTIKFLAPVGYPFAKPDCFWTDKELRLQANAMPKNTGFNPIPEVSGEHLWFSWHVNQWNPNRDNLSTYIHVVEARFKEIQ